MKQLNIPFPLLNDNDKIIDSHTCSECGKFYEMTGKTFLQGCPCGYSFCDSVVSDARKEEEERMEMILNLFKK